MNNEGIGTNKDYNAISWASTPIGTDSFRVAMKISELQYKEDNVAYELKVKLVHESGVIKEQIWSYTFKNGLPVITFGQRAETSKTGWTATSSSNQSIFYASNLIDNDKATYWQSKYTPSIENYPHTLIIDTKSAKAYNGISLTQRANVTWAVKDFEILVSSNGTDFKSLGNFFAGNADGTQYFAFAEKQTFRYFKVICKTPWTTNTDNAHLGGLAELGLY